MRVFSKQNCKIAAAGIDPSAVTPICYFNFIPGRYSAKYILLLSKKNEITIVNVLHLLLPHLCIYFSLQTQ